MKLMTWLENMKDLPSTNSTVLLANSRAIAFSFLRTFFFLFGILGPSQKKSNADNTSFVALA